MRTTLSIEDELAESIERLRAREKLSLREAVNRLLRAGLQAVETKSAAKPYRAQTFNMGVSPGIDPSRFNQLLDELDVEDFKG